MKAGPAKLDAVQKKALKALCGKRGKPELKRLFALIRAHEDRALFAAIAPPRKRKPKSTLAKELTVLMRPLLAPAAEKGELLVEQMSRLHRRKLKLSPTGLGDAVTRLRAADFTEAQIRAGAMSLMAELARLYAIRETVV